MIINAAGTEISVLLSKNEQNDYISLTDIARHKNPNDPRIVISNWLSSYSTIDFLATWETLYNPDFKRMEFHTFRSETGRLVYQRHVLNPPEQFKTLEKTQDV